MAETSVTVDGITMVIDSGLAKEAHFDAQKNKTQLIVQPICRSSATQRTGRAGRTRPGCAFRMYSEAEFKDMAGQPTAEILRTHLGSAVLKLKDLGVRDVLTFAFIEPPDSEALRAATRTLTRAGFLTQDGALTKNGEKAAHLTSSRGSFACYCVGLRPALGAISLLLAA